MRTLRPELVDVSVLPEDRNVPLIGVHGADPRSDDLEEFGRRVTQDIIGRMAAKTDELLAELEL